MFPVILSMCTDQKHSFNGKKIHLPLYLPWALRKPIGQWQAEIDNIDRQNKYNKIREEICP